MIFDLIAGMGAARASGGWTPANLFQGGEQGFWLDPSDLSTMFQDTAGTVPVTADGQAVALIRDKSGRNNNATQATLANRPLYKTDGVRHWLSFDGVNDYLTIAAMPVANLPGTSFAGFKHSTKSRWVMFLLSAQSTSYWSYARTGSNVLPNGTTVGSPTYRVNKTPLVTPTTQTMYDALIGIKSVQTVKDLILGTISSPINISTNVTEQMQGEMYSTIIVARAASVQEIDDTEDWINTKIGAY